MAAAVYNSHHPLLPSSSSHVGSFLSHPASSDSGSGDSQTQAPRPGHQWQASSIWSSTPALTKIPGYFLQIRQSIKKDKGFQLTAPTKFFDSVRFWQQASEGSEAEQSKLRDRIFELEQRNEGLTAKLRMGVLTDSTRNQLSNVAGRNVVSGEPPRKRARTLKFTRGELPPALEDELPKLETETLSILRQLYTLQKAMHKKTDPNHLATAAVMLCKVAERELLTAGQREGSGSKNPNPRETKHSELPAMINEVKLSFQLVGRTLAKLPSTEDGKKGRGQVTYYLVCLFESTMTALSQRCNPIQLSGRKQRLRTSTRMKAQVNKQTPVAPTPTDETPRRLTGLLYAMAQSLGLACSPDREVMEGLLYVLLERVGDILALSVGTNQGAPPRAACEGVGHENLSAQNVQVEGLYLVWLLEKMLALLTKSQSSCSAAQDVITKAKDRLQGILRQAARGCESSHTPSSLIRPATPPPQKVDCQTFNQQTFSDWFQQELWRLAGYDMLASILASD
ncbi:hypothetical protein N7474_000913 [Penicillium riverlandense]|uniref:uncharacterized protein n=1 Tax=Penicillium riverlandense TaxID=1903569 RepID=UPI002549A146|nr:uncharacterized protein N7474_000913 [Penicillium riverlandense]KAJ5832602.1 hypothetical protein N7474_000913 [Penicillium riverlandense]